MTPDSLRALLQRGSLTGSAAAKICGVNPRTVRGWIGGRSSIPYSALTLLQQHVAAMEFEADGEALESDALSQTLAERIAALQAIQAMQRQAAHRLDDELAEARLAHGQTTSTLNALYAERGKLEK
jgi:uncharacterized coiled-coil protein SlyX